MAQEQIINLDIFDNDKWLALTTDQRKDQLQQLENHYAAKEGRTAITLKYVPNYPYAGAFDSSNYSITLNESVLNVTKADADRLFNEGMAKGNLKDYNDLNWNRCQLIDAAIHEGKHADQYTVLQEVKNNHKYPDEKHPELDQDKIQLWKENDSQAGYLDAARYGEGLYRYQAQEDDAYEFTKKEMDKIWSQQNSKERDLYTNNNNDGYRDKMNRYDAKWLKDAENQLQSLHPGMPVFDVKIEINDFVHKKYTQAISQSQNIHPKIDSLNENSIAQAANPAKVDEIKNNSLAVNDLPRNPDSKSLFNAYAKEVLNENGQEWTAETNKKIAENMLKNGVRPQRIEEALKHSPEPVENAYYFVKDIKNSPEIQQVQQSMGMGR